MSTTVIYDTSSPWSSSPLPSAPPLKYALSPLQDSRRLFPRSSIPQVTKGSQDYRAFSCIPNAHAFQVDKSILHAPNRPPVLYSLQPPLTSFGRDIRAQEIASQPGAGNSRSARMRRALSIPARGTATTLHVPYSPHQPGFLPDNAHSLIPPRLQSGQTEVIAEFGPHDLYRFPDSSVNPLAGNAMYLGNTAIPPRMLASQPSGIRPRSKPWRPATEELPPRFRNRQPVLPRASNPSEAFLIQNPASPSSVQDNIYSSDAISSFPQLSQPQHLSSFLANTVSCPSGIPSNTRSKPPERKSLEPSPEAKMLAPIGTERAQRLASTASVASTNHCNNFNNSKPPLSHTNLSNDEPQHKLCVPFSPFDFTYEPSPRPPVRYLRLSSSRDAPCPQGPTELEKLYQWTRINKYAPRVVSPLSPLRNPDNLAPGDVKWRKQEREQRREYILSRCEVSVFRRSIRDRRSRTECEEYAYDLEVSEHCFYCRQDTLCKRLLVQHAREFIRSSSSSPVSDDSSSSEEAISDDERALVTPGDSIPLSISSISGKLLELDPITVVCAENDGVVAIDYIPAVSSRHS